MYAESKFFIRFNPTQVRPKEVESADILRSGQSGSLVKARLT